MRLSAPLPEPQTTPPFTGGSLRAYLEARTEDAISVVHRLALPTWTDADGDPFNPTPAIASDYDVEIPAPDWDNGTIQIGTTEDQRMRAVWSWTITGTHDLMVRRPDSNLVGLPTTRFGLQDRGLHATLSDATLSASQIDRAATETRHHVDRYLAFVDEQVERWRDGHRIRVRDAARKRRQLLEHVAEVTDTHV